MLIRIKYNDGQDYTCFPKEIRFDHFPKDRLILYFGRLNQEGVEVERHDYINLEDIKYFSVREDVDITPTTEELEGSIGGVSFEKYQEAFFRE